MFSWIWYLGSSGLDAPRRTLSADLIYGIRSQRSKTMVMELNPNTGSDRFWTTPAKFFNSRKWFSFSDWSNAIPPIMYADEIESCTCGSDTDSWTRVSKQLQLYLPFSPCPRREIVQKVLQLVNDGWRALGQHHGYAQLIITAETAPVYRWSSCDPCHLEGLSSYLKMFY